MKIKRIFAAITAAVLCLALTGCNDYSKLEGYNEVSTARDSYEALDSAEITVTDNLTGLVTQYFKFHYEGDVLTYYYMGTDGETTYYEYHNGYELSTAHGGDSDWTTIVNGDENYIVYTRASRYSLCTKGLLFLDGGSVSSSSKETMSDGNYKISFSYLPDRLSEALTKQVAGSSALKTFETVFVLSPDLYAQEMTQRGVMTALDGSEQTVDYTLRIENMNLLGTLERPALP